MAGVDLGGGGGGGGGGGEVREATGQLTRTSGPNVRTCLLAGVRWSPRRALSQEGPGLTQGFTGSLWPHVGSRL